MISGGAFSGRAAQVYFNLLAKEESQRAENAAAESRLYADKTSYDPVVTTLPHDKTQKTSDPTPSSTEKKSSEVAQKALASPTKPEQNTNTPKGDDEEDGEWVKL